VSLEAWGDESDWGIELPDGCLDEDEAKELIKQRDELLLALQECAEVLDPFDDKVLAAKVQSLLTVHSATQRGGI
jgi:hypothetical protein